MSDLRPLPLEVWQQIFGYLAVRDLKNALRVCHDWCQRIVGTSSLINRMQLRISRETTLDHRSSGIRFVLARKVCLFKTKIVSVDPWWSALGALLNDLDLRECQVVVPTLLTMLRQAPNLVRLTLDKVQYLELEDAVAADFQLNRLEYLSLGMTNGPRIVDVLRPACPALKSFAFSARESVPSEREVIELVRGVQGTLEELFVPINAVGRALLAMDRLKLRAVNLNRVEPEIILDVCRMQPDLQILDVRVSRLDDSQLCEIGQLLPNLRQLITNLDGIQHQEPRFLSAMPNLEQLIVSPGGRDFQQIESLGDFQCRKLKSLQLSWVILHSEEDAWKLLNRSRNIETLKLQECVFPQWSKFFDGLNALRSLKRLTLNTVTVSNWTNSARWVVNDSTKCLRLWNLQIPKAQLLQLLSAFPALEELHLCHMPAVDDGVVLELPRLFPQLRRLLIWECSNWKASLRHVSESLPALVVLKYKFGPVTVRGMQLRAQRYDLRRGKFDWCENIMAKLYGLFGYYS
ncbi:hypothetical protein quinque_015028 [Culex quinquefasciatus]